MRSKEELAEIYQRQARTVYMVAVGYGLQAADCEDVVQESFMRLLHADPVFNDPEHKKAWLIVTAANVCKNYLARSERKNLALPDWDQASDDGQHPSPGDSTPYNETSVLYGDGPAPYSETPDLCGENPSVSDRDCQLLACLGQLPARDRKSVV